MPRVTESAASRPWRESRNLAERLESGAERFPYNAAVVDVDGHVITYLELNAGAEQVAAFLTHQGVEPGDRVAVLLPKSGKAVMTIFGILKARATLVPLDWQAPAERICSVIRECGIRTAFADSALAPVLPALDRVILTGQLVGGGRPNAIYWSDVFEQRLPTLSRRGRERSDLAVIFCTSGSTGVPKAVMVSHGNLLTYADWCSSLLLPCEEDRFSSYTPFHFAFSVLDLYVSLRHGASLHLIDQSTSTNPKQLAEFIACRRLTVWCSTPSILRMLASSGHLHRFDYSSLRVVLFSGEAFPVPQLRQLMLLWQTPTYYNLWGSTENQGSICAVLPSPLPEGRNRPIPIGQPGWHCQAAVLNATGEPVSLGEEGELWLAGESVFQGYWNRPELDKSAFRLRGGARWYATGDIVREDPQEGLIYLRRRDRLVKRNGYRIELDDIQSALYQHKGIQEAAVVAVPAREGVDTKIGAYILPKSDARITVLEMKGLCAQHLPSYMSPDRFVFVSDLPRTSTNKVDYQALVRRMRDTIIPTGEA